MSLIPNQTNVNQDRYFFLLVDSKVVNTSTITANTGLFSSIQTQQLYSDLVSSQQVNASTITANTGLFSNIQIQQLYSDLVSSQQVNASTISSFNLVGYNNYLDYIKNIVINTNLVNLDSNALTASNGDLYINGFLVATPQGISSIDAWAKYPAIANIDANYSSIKNANGISSLYLSTGLINCDSIKAIGGRIDTLFGLDQINYPKARFEDLSANEIRTSSIFTNVLTSELIYNQNEISTYSVYADLGVYSQINSASLDASNATFSNSISVANNIETNSISSSKIYTNNISSGVVYSGNIYNSGLVDTDSLYASNALVSSLVVQYFGAIDTLVVNKNCLVSTLRANNISSLNVSTNNLFAENATFSNLNISSITASNVVVDNLYTNNIYNTSNINTSNLTTTGLIDAESADLSGNLVVDGDTTTNGHLNVNGNIFMFSDIIFDTNNIPITGTQYKYDLINVRNGNFEKLTVIGGATNSIPEYNDSIVIIGDNVLSPGQVTINGFNPDPFDTGIALTVDGDTQIRQNLNVLGVTTIEGILNVLGVAEFELDVGMEGELNVAGLTTLEGGLEVTGVADLLGDTNVGGILTVTGETNLLGAVTAEAGIGIVGALGLTGGDVTFGNSLDTSYTFTNHFGTVLSNGLTVYGNATYCNDIRGDNIFANNIRVSTIGTNVVGVIGDSVSDGAIGFYNSNLDVTASIVRNDNLSTLSIQSIDNLALQGFSTINMFASSIGVNSNINFTDLSGSITNAYYIQSENVFTSSFVVDTIAPKANIITIIGDINTRSGDIFFGDIVNNNKNFVSWYNTIFNNDVSVGTTSNLEHTLRVYGSTVVSNLRIEGATEIDVLTASTINTNYITGINSSNVFTDNLYPTSVANNIGFYGAVGSASGGWYNTINSRSTNTQVITPDNTGAFSNTLFLRGNVSTQQINTSSITGNNIFTIGTNSNLNYISTHAVRTSLLLPNPGQGGVINTCNIYPLATANQLGFGGSSAASWSNVWSRNFLGGQYRGESMDINSTINIRHHAVASSITVSTILGVQLLSTINTGSIITSNLQTQIIQPRGGSGLTINGTLIPGSFGSNLGGTGAGFRFGNVNTQNINISSITGTDGGTAISNIISMRGTVSTLNTVVSSITNNTLLNNGFISTPSLIVSSINNKLYPYTSSLGVFGSNSVSTYTINGTDAVVPQVLLSNIPFPYPGNYLITQKNTITKSSGGTGAEPYGCFNICRGLYPSTFATEDGFNSVAFINNINISTFNTFTTSITVDSNATTRNITYFDPSSHNYTINVALADIRIRYIPNPGVGADTGT